MFRDPKSGATWSGHGRASGWLAGASDRSKFLIAKAAEPAATAKAKTAKSAPAKKAIAKKVVTTKASTKKAASTKVRLLNERGDVPARTGSNNVALGT